MDPEIEGTSAAKGPEIEVTLPSATEDPEIRVSRGTSSSGTIFRAPAHISYGRESDFEPKLVFIGPYHHGRANLYPMEDTKTRFMSDLMNMSDDEKTEPYNFRSMSSVKKKKGPSHIDCVPVDPFMKFGSRARSFYEEKFDHSDVDFVRMLVLDSCFIIRIILSLSQYVERVPYSIANFRDVNLKEVRSDLLLLENQIPLFFIREVYAWLFRNANISISPNFVVVLKSFIRLDLPWNVNVNDVLLGSSAHLLDFYWRSSGPYQATDNQVGEFGCVSLKWAFAAKSQKQPAPMFMRTATELHQMAGIKFEKLNGIGLQVKFRKGILQIPCVRIDSSHTTIFVNLIAYENSMLPSIRIISTYIKLMDDLIYSKKDVKLLEKSGVIYNTLSSHSMAATYFHDLGNLCFINSDNNCFSQLFEDVEKYYRLMSSWYRWWVILKQDYFSSPWAVISVLAGVVLLFLSGAQTYYTVFRRNN